jgi:hypothetical protein
LWKQGVDLNEASVGGMMVEKTGNVGFENGGEKWLEKECGFLKQYEDCGIK